MKRDDGLLFPFLLAGGLFVVLISMLYLTNIAGTASINGDFQKFSLYNSASDIFLKLLFGGLFVYVLYKAGLFIEEPVDFLSGESNDQLSAGFLFALVIGGFFSFLKGFQLPLQSVFGQVSASGIPHFWDIMINGIAAPFVEEFFFSFAVPVLLLAIFINILSRFNFSKIVQNIIAIVLTIAITSVLFAYFHISSSASLFFLIGAISFRVAILSTIIFDELTNFVPLVSLGVGFGMGYHISQNLGKITNPVDFVVTLLNPANSVPEFIFGVITILWIGAVLYYGLAFTLRTAKVID